MAIISINDVKAYKKTNMKKHIVYIALPELGTRVVNRLTEEKYVTDRLNCFVVSGTVGDMKTDSLEGIANKYVLANGKKINLDNLRDLAIKLDSGSTVIDWFKAVSIVDKTDKWALFIPSNYILTTIVEGGQEVIINDPAFNHGYGDFVLCNTLAGKPNIRSIKVINGITFPNIYSMNSFRELSAHMIGNKTPKPKSFILK